LAPFLGALIGSTLVSLVIALSRPRREVIEPA
jgi:hypothetical protein